jgi:hypothetical protein
MTKIRVHLLVLPRWFAAPFFGSAMLFGCLLAGPLTLYSLVGIIAGLLIMAGGHSFNSYLDYAWTGLDSGAVDERSAEKTYTRGQSVIASGLVGLDGVLINAIAWYTLSTAPVAFVAVKHGWPIALVAVLGMGTTFWYSIAKFNWTHELALGIACGPLAVTLGMWSTSAHPQWISGVVASVPFAVVLSFAGLAVDEWPDAEANLKKGVRSIAYKVWENEVGLEWYAGSWIVFAYVYQLFLVIIGTLKPLTGLSFLAWPFYLALLVLMKKDFKRMGGIITIVGAFHEILIVLGQGIG